MVYENTKNTKLKGRLPDQPGIDILVFQNSKVLENMIRLLCGVLCVLALLSITECHNKYSKEANAGKQEESQPPTLKTLEKPFRMAKLNTLWTKAQMVSLA